MSGYRALVRSWLIREPAAHPVAVAYAAAFGRVWGMGINGQRGTILANSTADDSPGFLGYAAPPQLFTGWNPANQRHVGTPLITPGGLPDTSVPGGVGPLDSAMAQIVAGTSQ